VKSSLQHLTSSFVRELNLFSPTHQIIRHNKHLWVEKFIGRIISLARELNQNSSSDYFKGQILCLVGISLFN